jgi:hypothetical protein
MNCPICSKALAPGGGFIRKGTLYCSKNCAVKDNNMPQRKKRTPKSKTTEYKICFEVTTTVELDNSIEPDELQEMFPDIKTQEDIAEHIALCIGIENRKNVPGFTKEQQALYKIKQTSISRCNN